MVDSANETHLQKHQIVRTLRDTVARRDAAPYSPLPCEPGPARELGGFEAHSSSSFSSPSLALRLVALVLFLRLSPLFL